MPAHETIRCPCILIDQIRAVLLALLCLILRRQRWSICTCLSTECKVFCKQTMDGNSSTSQQRVSSLVWWEDNTFFCLVPGGVLQSKKIGNVWGKMYVFVYIQIHITTCVHVYTQIPIWEERHVFLITLSTRTKREIFPFSLWMQFCLSPRPACCSLMQGWPLPAILQSTQSTIHTDLTETCSNI